MNSLTTQELATLLSKHTTPWHRDAKTAGFSIEDDRILTVWLFDGCMGDVFNDVRVCRINARFVEAYGATAPPEHFTGRGWQERLAKRVAELVDAALVSVQRKATKPPRHAIQVVRDDGFDRAEPAFCGLCSNCGLMVDCDEFGLSDEPCVPPPSPAPIEETP